MEFVEVDGSRGEGGGQILRTATAFSVITHRPVRVSRIRAGRKVPGLRRQHLSAVSILAEAFGARLEGAFEGSSEVSFVPGEFRRRSLSVDMKTAASITLVLQSLIPAAALTGNSLQLGLVGGTDVPWSPTFDYLEVVVRAAYRRIGVEFDAEAASRGYYPRGGGRVAASIGPCASLRPLDLPPGEKPRGVVLQSRCAGLPRHVAERQLAAASDVLEGAGIRVLERKVAEESSVSPGSSILASFTGTDVFLGSDAIGAKGVPAEEVGRAAAEKFVQEARSGACLDLNLADMVIPLLALAPSPSRVRVREVTPHLGSGLETAGLFTSCSWSFDPQAGSTVVTVVPGRRS